nr:helix-turn-helix domain-containing protein [Propionicimonas sp.]
MIEDVYPTFQIDARTRHAVAAMMHTAFDKLMATETDELADLAARRERLEDEQLKLLQAHYAGAVPLDLLKNEQDRIGAGLETVKNRIDAHHAEYAQARANLEDSLTLLENAATMYARADDANRRLCNQAFFKKIYIDEGNGIRVDYATPFDTLCDPKLQADSFTWAASAKQGVRVQSPFEGDLATEILNPARLSCRREVFSSLSPQTRTLAKRWYRGVYRELRRPEIPQSSDLPGPVIVGIENAHALLTAVEVDRLVGEYLGGAGVAELADRYGVHRTTVATHLRRRSTPRRLAGLDINERAEAVRLYRSGISLRAIGRRMGVDRKTVRAVVVSAGVAIRSGRGAEA